MGQKKAETKNRGKMRDDEKRMGNLLDIICTKSPQIKRTKNLNQKIEAQKCKTRQAN